MLLLCTAQGVQLMCELMYQLYPLFQLFHIYHILTYNMQVVLSVNVLLPTSQN